MSSTFMAEQQFSSPMSLMLQQNAINNGATTTKSGWLTSGWQKHGQTNYLFDFSPQQEECTFVEHLHKWMIVIVFILLSRIDVDLSGMSSGVVVFCCPNRNPKQKDYGEEVYKNLILLGPYNDVNFVSNRRFFLDDNIPITTAELFKLSLMGTRMKRNIYFGLYSPLTST